MTSNTRSRVFFWDMRVRVLYFGVLKDAFGRAGSDVVLADGASVADLLKVVRGQEGFWDSIAVAVNQEYAKGSDVLKEGDEVALLPPVSGGLGVLGSLRSARKCGGSSPSAQNDKRMQMQRVRVMSNEL
jgi:molybdopterin converting factor subunit 1